MRIGGYQIKSILICIFCPGSLHSMYIPCSRPQEPCQRFALRWHNRVRDSLVVPWAQLLVCMRGTLDLPADKCVDLKWSTPESNRANISISISWDLCFVYWFSLMCPNIVLYRINLFHYVQMPDSRGQIAIVSIFKLYKRGEPLSMGF